MDLGEAAARVRVHSRNYRGCVPTFRQCASCANMSTLSAKLENSQVNLAIELAQLDRAKIALSDFPHIDFTRTTASFGFCNHVTEKFILNTRQVAAVSFTHVALRGVCLFTIRSLH